MRKPLAAICALKRLLAAVDPDVFLIDKKRHQNLGANNQSDVRMQPAAHPTAAGCIVTLPQHRQHQETLFVFRDRVTIKKIAFLVLNL